jgi:ATP-dependent Clp protease ATP-binding subunit ClpC
LFGRQLPDRVIDLLDEAGARARMRRETESAELIALRQRIRRIARTVESAITNLELEKARQWAEEEDLSARTYPGSTTNPRRSRHKEVRSHQRTFWR